MVFADSRFQARERAYVLAPEASFYRQWATPRAPGWRQGGVEELDEAVALTREVMASRPIDPRRVYVMGASQGGIGVFAAFARHPDLFAAGVSFAGAWDARESGALKRSNIWALHGLADRTVPARHSIEAVEGIRRLGGAAKLTLLPGETHGWRMTPQMGEAVEWMLKQRQQAT